MLQFDEVRLQALVFVLLGDLSGGATSLLLTRRVHHLFYFVAGILLVASLLF